MKRSQFTDQQIAFALHQWSGKARRSIVSVFIVCIAKMISIDGAFAEMILFTLKLDGLRWQAAGRRILCPESRSYLTTFRKLYREMSGLKRTAVRNLVRAGIQYSTLEELSEQPGLTIQSEYTPDINPSSNHQSKAFNDIRKKNGRMSTIPDRTDFEKERGGLIVPDCMS